MADNEKIDQLFNLRAAFPTREETAAFFLAAERNDLGTLGAIIDKWPDAPKKWRSGLDTIITKHYRKMSAQTISYLVARGADIDALADNNSWSAVLQAAFHDQPEHLEKLLRCGAECDRPDRFNLTALHYAAEAGNYACADMLVLCGANPEKGLCATKNADMHKAIESASARRQAFLASLQPTPAALPDAARVPLPQPVPIASDNVIHIMKRIELKKAGKDPGPDIAEAPPAVETSAAAPQKHWLKRILKW